MQENNIFDNIPNLNIEKPQALIDFENQFAYLESFSNNCKNLLSSYEPDFSILNSVSTAYQTASISNINKINTAFSIQQNDAIDNLLDIYSNWMLSLEPLFNQIENSLINILPPIIDMLDDTLKSVEINFDNYNFDYLDNNYNNVTIATSISEAEKFELAEDITLLCEENKENWQVKVKSVLSKWKEKNPVLFPLLMVIIGQLFSSFFNLAFQSATASQNTPITSEAMSSSEIIRYALKDENITIIGLDDEYYQIEFIDDDTGETVQGWVSKKDIQITSQDNTIESEN